MSSEVSDCLVVFVCFLWLPKMDLPWFTMIYNISHSNHFSCASTNQGEKEAVKLKQIAARQVQMLKMLLQRPDLEVAVRSKLGTQIQNSGMVNLN